MKVTGHCALVSAASLQLHSPTSDLRNVRASRELGAPCVNWEGALCTADHEVGTEFCIDLQVLPGSILPWLSAEILLSFSVSYHFFHYSPPSTLSFQQESKSQGRVGGEKMDQWYTRKTRGRDFQRMLRKD